MTASPGRAWVRFYAELNDHLPAEQRFRTIEREFFVPGTAKDLIQSFGVPHPEVELILVNGESAGWDRLICDGDRVAVYPVFESFDITPELRLRPQALREPKFLLDVHLGRLAGYLRMLGFDTAYSNSAGDPKLARLAGEERRILLTRDRGLLKRSAVTHGYWLRETDSRRQTAEVVRRFDLSARFRPFTRCMACNAPLRPASRAEVLSHIPAGAAQWYEEFQECAGCGRVYWQGSHYRRMQHWIETLATLQ